LADRFDLRRRTVAVEQPDPQEFADTLWPQLRFVEIGELRASFDAPVEVAVFVHGGALARLIKPPAAPDRSTEIVFDYGNGLITPAFVDPYTGEHLGSVSAITWLPGLMRKLHGDWPLGAPGSWPVELGASWTLVMLLTGLSP
jgi:uncharacterized iron-regulated membrane protein